MTTKKLQEIFREHGIPPADIADIANAISKAFQTEIERLERDEPYATRSIAELKDAESRTYDLLQNTEDEE